MSGRVEVQAQALSSTPPPQGPFLGIFLPKREKILILILILILVRAFTSSPTFNTPFSKPNIKNKLAHPFLRLTFKKQKKLHLEKKPRLRFAFSLDLPVFGGARTLDFSSRFNRFTAPRLVYSGTATCLLIMLFFCALC